MVRGGRTPAQPQFLGMVPEPSVGEAEEFGSLFLVATGLVQRLPQEIRTNSVEVFLQIQTFFRQYMPMVPRLPCN